MENVVQKVPMDKDKCSIYFALDDYTNMFRTVTNSQKCFTYIILNVTYFYTKHQELPIPVATRSKALVLRQLIC
jgi:hypothetical protein